MIVIHKTAVIHPKAIIADNVEIGPYSMIGSGVELDEGCKIGPHVVIEGPSFIGKNNHFFQFSSIGAEPQDKKFKGEDSKLVIGDNNAIREFVTINRGTDNGGGETRIGDSNLLMAYVHIAHDCIIGNNTVFANTVGLSGHVCVKDYVTIGGFAGVRQFTTIGAHSFVAAQTLVVKDVLPYVLVSGQPAEPNGLNSIGLRRREFTDETIMALKRAYKIIYRQGLIISQALDKLEAMVAEVPEIQLMIDALKASTRGVTR